MFLNTIFLQVHVAMGTSTHHSTHKPSSPPSSPPSSSSSSSSNSTPKVVTTSWGLTLHHRSQIPAIYKEPYIIDGYRKPNSTVTESLRYLFVKHNDVGNFWTHFIPLCVWLWWLYRLSLRLDLTNPYFYPLLCYWAGSCSYAFFSCFAHTFSVVSFTVRTVCFMLDYLGIAMYGLGCSLVIFFYEQPIKRIWFDWFEKKWLVLSLQMVLAINAALFCSLSRFFWKNHRFTIRASAFVAPYILMMIPFLERVYVCVKTGNECIPETLHLHLLCVIVTHIVAFFFVTKIPERFSPGRFDIIGQSHQLFHIAAVILTSIQMYMYPKDAILRRDELAQVKDAAPEFHTTFLPYVVVQVTGLLVVAVFWRLIVRGVLVSNKRDVVKETKKLY